MFNKRIPVACLTAMLGFSAPSMAQLGDLAKQAGKATVDTTKSAAKTTSEGAQKVGSGAKKGTHTATTETKNAVTGRPQGTTGQCKDGTYTKAKARSSACSVHGGIEKWSRRPAAWHREVHVQYETREYAVRPDAPAESFTARNQELPQDSILLAEIVNQVFLAAIHAAVMVASKKMFHYHHPTHGRAL